MQVFRFIVRSHGRWTTLAIAALLACIGCDSGGYSGPTGTVSGTVTVNGEAAPAGTRVAFVSDQGFTASGQVEPGGKYELVVAGQDKQIPAAKYKVMVSPPAGGGPSEADYDKLMEQAAAGNVPSATTPEMEKAIPAKYRSTATSGLSYTVEEGSNTINIRLGEGEEEPAAATGEEAEAASDSDNPPE